MKSMQITLPELGMIAGTRVALGAGLGLLLANHLSESQRAAVGWTLVAFGGLMTVPLAAEVLGHRTKAEAESAQPGEARFGRQPELARS